MNTPEKNTAADFRARGRAALGDAAQLRGALRAREARGRRGLRLQPVRGSGGAQNPSLDSGSDFLIMPLATLTCKFSNSKLVDFHFSSLPGPRIAGNILLNADGHIVGIDQNAVSLFGIKISDAVRLGVIPNPIQSNSNSQKGRCSMVRLD